MRKQDQVILVVGLVRNGSKFLPSQIARIAEAIGEVKRLKWFLVESDSNDNTVSVLKALSERLEFFYYRSLGRLRDVYALRTERIAFCRNIYVDELRRNPLYCDVDYVVVADLDGLNNALTPSSFSSCWLRSDWDVCTANQFGPYYDIWALRHPLWSPNDCWESNDFLNEVSKKLSGNLEAAVFSRMIIVDPAADWIEVESAFGGFAVYKKEAMMSGVYVGLNASGKEVCEHVYFHEMLRRNGFRIFINPRLINATVTEHTRHFYFPHNVLLFFKGAAKRLLHFFKNG